MPTSAKKINKQNVNESNIEILQIKKDTKHGLNITKVSALLNLK